MAKPILGSELSWGHWDVRLCRRGWDLGEVVSGVGSGLTVLWVLADSYKNLGVNATFRWKIENVWLTEIKQKKK